MKKNNNRRRKGNNSNRGFSRPDARGCERDERSSKSEAGNTKPYNDISWYTHYPNLVAAASNFPYPIRPGMTVALEPNVALDPSKQIKGQITVPGVMAISWSPTFGKSQSAIDPASVVAKELYAKVRKAYSGALDADAPDMFMYLGALDGLFSYIAALRRIYRILTAWTPDNYAVPGTLLHALGLNEATATSLRSERVKLWQYINELTLQSRKFTCPAVMDLFNRHFWMNDNVYTDAPSINSQMYVFKQSYFLKYSEVAMPNGDMASGLVAVATPIATNATVDQLYTFGNSLIEALVAWDEAYTINGYFSRAFDGVPNFIVDETELNPTFNPVYSEEVLSQIENSRSVTGFTLQVSSLTVSQDVTTNAVLCRPQVKLGTDVWGLKAGNFADVLPLLSIRSDAPSPTDNIIASRLHTTVEATSTADLYDVVCATELVTAMDVYNSDTYAPYQFPSLMAYVEGTSPAQSIWYLMRALNVGMFDWHPIGIYYYANATNKDTMVVGDLHNFTILQVEDLRNLHKICVYSELNAFSI